MEPLPLEGDLPSPANPPPGCNFSTRCFKVAEDCRTNDPALEPHEGDAHPAACFYAAECEV